MFTLNEKSRNKIKKVTGLSVDEISKMSSSDIDKCIEEKIGKKIKIKFLSDMRLIGRGSVYLFLHRLLSLESIERKLAKYF